METIVGIGTDLSSINRFRHLNNKERIAEFFCSPAEWKTLRSSSDLAQSLATRFATKEAVIKATPIYVSPLDFEIVKSGPKPTVQWLQKSLPFKVLLSVTHECEYASAFAICTTK